MTGRLDLAARFRLGTVRAGFASGRWLAPACTVDRAARLFATPFASSRNRAQAVQAVQGDAEMQRGESQVQGETIATYFWGDPSTQPYALLAHGWCSFGLRYLPWVVRLRALVYAVTFAQDENWHADRLILVAPAADMKAAARCFFRFVHPAGYLRALLYEWLHRRTGVHIDELQVERKLPLLGQLKLIVHDLDDDDVPWGEGERYARYWPGARLLTTQGLGHRRVLDAPEVIEAALAFIRGEQVGAQVVGSPNLALCV